MTADVQDPERWERTILGTPRWTTQIQWSNDGGQTWQDAQYVSGTVTCDATSRIRWSTDGMVLVGPFGWDGFSPFRTRFKIRHGIWYGPNDVDLIGMGVYRCTDAEQDDNNPDQIIVSGSSFEHYMISPWGAFGRTRTFAQNSGSGIVSKLVLEVLPEATIAWRGVDGSTTVPALTTDADRWDLIDGSSGAQSVARALGARAFFDGDGSLIIAKRGTIEDAAVWSAKRGESKITGSTKVSLDGLYNIVAVTGADANGGVVGPYTVADVDPHSKTNVNLPINQGGIGRSLYQYSNDIITNRNQALASGQSILQNSRGLQQTMSFTRLYNPRLRPDDAGAVDTPAGVQKAIFDTLNFDLTGAPMDSCTVRTTSTQFTGQLTEFVDPDQAGGE